MQRQKHQQQKQQAQPPKATTQQPDIFPTFPSCHLTGVTWRLATSPKTQWTGRTRRINRSYKTDRSYKKYQSVVHVDSESIIVQDVSIVQDISIGRTGWIHRLVKALVCQYSKPSVGLDQRAVCQYISIGTIGTGVDFAMVVFLGSFFFPLALSISDCREPK